MPHLDEGRIVELLDEGREGDPAWEDVRAHLAECAECRALAEEHQRIRDRAGAILSGSGPAEAPAPPFADVLARARQPASRGARPRTLRTVALAATVAIAVGVGWYARGSLADPEPRADASSEVAPVTRGPAERTAPTETRPAPAVAAVPAAPEPAAPARAPTPVPALTGRAVAAADADRASGAAGARGDAAAERDELPERTDLGVTGGVASRADSPPVAQPTVVPVSPDVRLREAPVEAVAEEVDVPLEDRARQEQERKDSWRVVDLQEAEQLLGGSVARIEGLATLGHAVRLERGGYAVRTRQQLGEVELELVQRSSVPAAAARLEPRRQVPAAALARDSVADRVLARRRAAPLAEATVVTQPGFAITGRAPIPPDSLRALLARLRL